VYVEKALLNNTFERTATGARGKKVQTEIASRQPVALNPGMQEAISI